MEFVRKTFTASALALFTATLIAVAVPSGGAAADGKNKFDQLLKKTFSKKGEKASDKAADKKVAKKESKAAPAPTCNAIDSLGVCYAFSGVKNSEQKVSRGNEMGCKFMKGRFIASDTCPPAKAMGRCTVKAGEPEEYSLYYYEGGRFNRASAEKDCKDPKSGIHAQGAGVWKAL